MDALFRVDWTLTIASCPLFFLAGEILEGAVRMGMVAIAGPAHRPAFREAIEAIEAADSISERKSWVVLGFRYTSPAELERWQAMEWTGVTLRIPSAPILHPCPCCGFRTLVDEARGAYDICRVCGWEDDFVQYDHPDYRGGANAQSLNEARTAFAAAHPTSAPGPMAERSEPHDPHEDA
jgi:Cysteine-rich CPCC